MVSNPKDVAKLIESAAQTVPETPWHILGVPTTGVQLYTPGLLC